LPSEKLPRRERITAERDFKPVFEEGKVFRGEIFKVYVLKNGRLGRRAGFIAGRTVGNACRRNRAKRLLKEAYRRTKNRMKPGGFNLVFIAKPGMAEAAYARVETEMIKALERFDLLGDR
jgi:ribonuclease P protein component